jgi:hypothetical protein
METCLSPPTALAYNPRNSRCSARYLGPICSFAPVFPSPLETTPAPHSPRRIFLNFDANISNLGKEFFFAFGKQLKRTLPRCTRHKFICIAEHRAHKTRRERIFANQLTSWAVDRLTSLPPRRAHPANVWLTWTSSRSTKRLPRKCWAASGS